MVTEGLKYSEDQPRVPAGQPGGGEFGAGGGFREPGDPKFGTFRLYHGTTMAAVDEAKHGHGYLPNDYRRVAAEVEKHFALPKDSVLNHPRFYPNGKQQLANWERNGGKRGGPPPKVPSVYLTPNRLLARYYSGLGSETVHDAIRAAAEVKGATTREEITAMYDEYKKDQVGVVLHVDVPRMDFPARIEMMSGDKVRVTPDEFMERMRNGGELKLSSIPHSYVVATEVTGTGLVNPNGSTTPALDMNQPAKFYGDKDAKYSADEPRDEHGRWGSGEVSIGSSTDSPSDDYHIQHQPNPDGPPAHDLLAGGMMPDDVYDHPEYYVGDPNSRAARESIAQLRAVRGKPDAMVTIYRSAPAGAKIEPGNWVSLSRTYAADSGRHATDPKQDMPVTSMKVPAAQVRFAGDDLNEFGYFPPSQKDAKYSDAQPRVPAGQPGGGEFGSGGGESQPFHTVNLKPTTRQNLVAELMLATMGGKEVSPQDYLMVCGKYALMEQDMNKMTPEEYRAGGHARSDTFYRLQETMGDYETADAWMMNMELRNGTDPAIVNMSNHSVAEVDECFREFGAAFEEDKTVYRGAIMEPPTPGEVYHDEAFLSTIPTPGEAVYASSDSYARTVAEHASEVQGASTVWEINIPAGQEVLGVRPDEVLTRSRVNESGEPFMEVVLNRGADLHIESVEKKAGGVYVVKATYLGSHPTKADATPRGINKAASKAAPDGTAWRFLWLSSDMVVTSKRVARRPGQKGEGTGHGFRGNRWTGGINGEGRQTTTPRAKIGDKVGPYKKGPKTLTHATMTTDQRATAQMIVKNMPRALIVGMSYSEHRARLDGDRTIKSHPLNPSEHAAVARGIASLESVGITHEEFVRALAIEAVTAQNASGAFMAHVGSGKVTAGTIESFSRDLTFLKVFSTDPTADPNIDHYRSRISHEQAAKIAEPIQLQVEEAQRIRVAANSQGGHMIKGEFPAFARPELEAVRALIQRDGSLFPEKLPHIGLDGKIDRTAYEDGQRVWREHLDAITAVGRAIEEEKVARQGPALAMAEAARGVREELMDRQRMAWEKLQAVPYRSVDTSLKPDHPRYAEEHQKYLDYTAARGEYDSLKEQASIARIAAESADSNYSRVRFDVLSEIRSLATRDDLLIGKSTNAKATEAFKLATSYFPADWMERAMGRTKLDVGVANGRAFCDGYLAKTGSYLSEDNKSTAVHEMSHFMENYGGRSIEASEYAFYLSRTNDGLDPTRKLRDVQPGYRYKASEITRTDTFAEAYMGKDYGGTPRSNYELLSMGMEHLRASGIKYTGTDTPYRHWLLGTLATV